MSVLDIVRYPHDALTTAGADVTAFGAELHTFLDDMAETMYAADGVGLAANQVAVLQRVTVIDTGEEGPGLLELVNPRVVEREGEIIWQEGCLSFPELFFDVKRASHVKVAYVDRHGAAQEIEADGLLAVALQHEIDHLDGVVFTERISKIDKRLMLRKYRRIMERRRAEGLEPEAT